MQDQTPLARAFLDAVADDAAELIILPTEKCNFRCTYCYESFEVGRMSETTIRSVERLTARRAGDLRRLGISWFGGEPTIALDIVERLSRHFRSLEEQHPALQYSGSMTTNGYRLDLETISRLADLGIRDYQISLDGPRAHHDSTRLRANGAGSFNVIWSNLEAIRASNVAVRVMIRLHVTPENLPALEDFVPEIRARFLTDPRFSVLFMPVAHLGGANDDKFKVIPNGETLTVLRHLNALACGDAAPVIPEFDGCAGCPLGEEDVCYASKPNSLVIRANGTLSKCTVGLDDPRNLVGRLRADGTIAINDRRFAAWMRGWQTGDLNDLACPRDSFFTDEDDGVDGRGELVRA